MARRATPIESRREEGTPDLSQYMETFKQMVRARYPTATFRLTVGLESDTWFFKIYAPAEDDLELEERLADKATDFLIFDDVAISPLFLPQWGPDVPSPEESD